MEQTVIYTDGACLNNPGPGGWAWAVNFDIYGCGGENNTTNQRMELTACLKALEGFKGDKVTIISDSQYLVKCFIDGWWKNWIKNSWKTKNKQPVKNQDLWKGIIELVDKYGFDSVSFEWVKGHSGVELNEFVDTLATSEAKKLL
jgi:ribonuclease HI